ncbi:MAG TPA: hypothetical protein ENJ88_03200 [Phaeodactylibacter sp.]|nr:hypothetical protein [Phaeodactylibacter sp.]
MNGIGLVLCLSANGCRPAESPRPQPAVYRWKTSPGLLPPERAWMDSLGIRRLYLRFFDIDRSADPARPLPVAPLQLPLKNLPDSAEVVPVVFITNRTFEAFLSLEEEQQKTAISQLARRLYEKIRAMESRLYASGEHLPKGVKVTTPEWQMDCDWTPKTRDAYFFFLGELRRLLHDSLLLSATIRLHQVKYPGQTGIPPVDRGMLMFYNMDDVRAADTRNSILDRSVASAYYGRLGEYPLPLDVALPVFGWVVVRREGKVVQLLSGLDERALADTARFEALDGAKLFRVRRSTYLNAYYLYAGDSLRVEGVEADSLRAAWSDLQMRLPREQRHLALYHLDTASVNRLNHEEIHRILGW